MSQPTMIDPDEPQPPTRRDTTPPIVWGLLGVLLVAAFVLIVSFLRG